MITYEHAGDLPAAQMALQTHREEWTVLGDAAFFCLRAESGTWLGDGGRTLTAAAYDTGGNLIARQEPA